MKPTNKGEKLSVDATISDIQQHEDEVAQLQRELSDIRQGMKNGQIDHIKIKVRTFQFYLKEARMIVKDWKSAFEQAEIVASVARVRERKEKEMIERQKKR